ncbi:family 16 glycoside hydrolase [Siphonobacter curvatus]|uniref:PA14 domain-containing protein n=1 Tax=Siphonobacter curvatus TaxID=2094562 RepID=A0A2S7IJ20_9BACT|nr:family 16 glycoside hydrolase [Siphonobacter curvatus]PQA56390.1 hypothetical protein C5O19_18350 [Siphonobacter curvatus]
MQLKQPYKPLLWGLMVGCVLHSGVWAQQTPTGQALKLTDLSAFKKPNGSNWQIVGDASAPLSATLSTSKGSGILVNLPNEKNKANLLSTLEHGDIDLELDYLMAKGSNSGIYLQGRYEIQLMDSWGVKGAKIGDNGSIYQRWDDKRGAGKEGYEGQAARQNASKAPGLWQHLRISFQAPRFDAKGVKVENARIVRLELNGVAIHENVELSGPTRGPLANNEVARGPILIQGDHGAVAFRNIQYTAYDTPRPALTSLTYQVYTGAYDKEPDLKTATPASKGNAKSLSAGVVSTPSNFLIQYKGTLQVKEAGSYTMQVVGVNGFTALKVNGKSVGDWTMRSAPVTVELPAGNVPIELVYSKLNGRGAPSLGLMISGTGLRPFYLGDGNAEGMTGNENGPILIEAANPIVHRSFMDVPNGRERVRVTHAISVGSPQEVHYTYDLDKGALVQVWKGEFLDATPMWNSRGDGSSRPTGMVQRFGVPALSLSRLSSPQAAWVADTVGSQFRPKGYTLKENQPTFRYQSYGSMVEDAIQVLPGREGVKREITVEKPAADLYARLAQAERIQTLSDQLYLIGDKAYYIQLEGGVKPLIRQVNGQQELLVPMRSGKLSYSLLF